MTPLDWALPVAEVPATARSLQRDATANECAAIAAELGLVACTALSARYTVKPLGGGRYQLAGHCDARVLQPCVVTLEPVPAAVSLSFDVEFVPAERPQPARLAPQRQPARHEDGGEDDEATADPHAGEAPVLSLPDVEPIENATLAIGRVIFETLAAGLDPYPRAPGAVFDWEDPQIAAGKGSAFAALTALKAKPEPS